MYVLTGATGKTGRIISNILLNHGQKVRAIARNAERLSHLEDNGAEIMPGDLENENFVLKAFQGAKAAYVLIPPNVNAENFTEYQIGIIENIASALEKSDITHVVALSSVGAHLPENNGVVKGLHYMEQRLNKIESLHVKYIRATYFMENLFQTIEMVKANNRLALPVDPHLKFPMTGKRDVAKVIVQHLLDLDFEGKSVDYVLGERDVSFAGITEVLGKAIGRYDLSYSQVTYDSTRKSLIKKGMSESAADAHTEFLHAINEGYLFGETERTPENTTPISIEEFSRQYALLYESRQPVV